MNNPERMFPWFQKVLSDSTVLQNICLSLDRVSIDCVLLANAFHYVPEIFHSTCYLYVLLSLLAGKFWILEYLAQENQSWMQVRTTWIIDIHPYNSQESDSSPVTSSLSVLQAMFMKFWEWSIRFFSLQISPYNTHCFSMPSKHFLRKPLQNKSSGTMTRQKPALHQPVPGH